MTAETSGPCGCDDVLAPAGAGWRICLECGELWPPDARETKCFECGEPAEHAHHVVPQSLGGTRTLPLCARCHGLVHGAGLGLPALVRAGQDRARREGRRIGRPPASEEHAARFRDAMAAARRGAPLKRTARQYGVSINTIRKYLRQEAA